MSQKIEFIYLFLSFNSLSTHHAHCPCPQDKSPHFLKQAKIWMDISHVIRVRRHTYVARTIWHRTFGCNFLGIWFFLCRRAWMALAKTKEFGGVRLVFCAPLIWERERWMRKIYFYQRNAITQQSVLRFANERKTRERRERGEKR